MNKKNMILMSTLLVCSLESFAQSDAEVNRFPLERCGSQHSYRGCIQTTGKNGDRQDDLQRAAGC